MPSYHIWIKKEDDATWRAIENKPEWLHERLNETNQVWANAKQVADEMIEGGGFEELLPEATIDNIITAEQEVISQVSQCPHYQPKGQCMVKGCKYGR